MGLLTDANIHNEKPTMSSSGTKTQLSEQDTDDFGETYKLTPSNEGYVWSPNVPTQQMVELFRKVQKGSNI